MITALFGAILFYLFPIIIGFSLLRVFKFTYRKYFPVYKTEHNLFFAIVKTFRDFALGNLVIYFVAIASNYAKGYLNISFTYLFTYLITVLFAVCFGFFIWQKLIKAKGTSIVSGKEIAICVFLVVISIFSYLIWRWDSPFNTTLNWDLYEHQLLAEIISEGKFSIVTSELSDTFQFNSYSTNFHVLAAIPQMLFKIDPLTMWWFLELFHLVSTVFVSFAAAYSISKSKTVSVIAAIIGVFVFESYVTYTSLFLIPQNLSATVLTAFIAKVLFDFSEGRPISLLEIVVISVYAFLNHLILGSIGIIAVLCIGLYTKLEEKMGRKFEATMLLFTLFLLVALPIAATLIDLNFINRGEARFFNYPFMDKVYFMRSYYGFSLLILLPLGVYEFLRRRDKNYNMFLILAMGLFSSIVAAIPYSLKFYAIDRYLIHTLMAFGLYVVIKDSGKLFKFLSIAIFSLFFVGIYINNIFIFKQTPYYKDISTHVSQNEIEAADFIRKNYSNKNAMIVSEPATMFILEGLSGVNSPGGAYATIHTREVLEKIFLERDSTKMADELFSIQDLVETKPPEVILLAVGGRFSSWQLADQTDKFGIHWNVWKPHDITMREGEFTSYLSRYSSFKTVFKNRGIIIYEVNKGI